MNEDLKKLLVRLGLLYVGAKVLPVLLERLDSIEWEWPPPQAPLPPPQTHRPLSPPLAQQTHVAPPVQPASSSEVPDLEAVLQRIRVSAPIVIPQPMPPSPLPPDYDLAQVMPRSGVVVGTGGRGSGKSVVIGRAQELLKDRLRPYAVGLPPSAGRLLPPWYGLVDDISAVPNKASIYLPESHRSFNARSTQSALGRAVGDIVNLVRHREWLLFFDVQNLAHLDRNILSEVDVLLIKEPGPFIQGFDRPQFREHIGAARAAFAGVGPTRRKRVVWVVAPAAGIHGKLMENALPTFWSDGLSRAFADTRPGIPSGVRDGHEEGARLIRRAAAPTTDELRLRARQLHAAGHSYGEIAKILGVSKTQAWRLVNED